MSLEQSKSKKRILVVEDRNDLRQMYVKNLNRTIENLEVDETDSKTGAIELIKRKTYHVAILDIMLAEDRSDRGGILVLDYLKELKEGTLSIMLSGSPDINCAIHALRSRIVVDYIHKSEIQSPEIYLNPIQKALEEVQIPLFGKYGRLTSFLAAPEKIDVGQWEFKSLQGLFDGGFDPLSKALSQTFIPMCPVLPKKMQAFALNTDEKNKALYGAFWSKAIGNAIWICLNSTKGSPVIPEECSEKPIFTNSSRNINMGVWIMENATRDQFLDSIWDS